jgi:hypothetical protein
MPQAPARTTYVPLPHMALALPPSLSPSPRPPRARALRLLLRHGGDAATGFSLLTLLTLLASHISDGVLTWAISHLTPLTSHPQHPACCSLLTARQGHPAVHTAYEHRVSHRVSCVVLCRVSCVVCRVSRVVCRVSCVIVLHCGLRNCVLCALLCAVWCMVVHGA